MNRQRWVLTVGMRGGTCAAIGVFGILVGCNLTLPGGGVVINQQPTADAGPDQNVDAGERVTLIGLASADPDDDPLTYLWQQRSGPSVALENPNSAQAGFVPTEQGTYEFAITVTDSRGGSDESTTRIFVGTGPRPGCPQADAGVDQQVNEGAAVVLRGANSADPAGGLLTYAWNQTSGPQVSVSGVFIAEPTFAAPQVDSDANLQFELTVTNESGCADTDAVIITVRNRDAADPCATLQCENDGVFCNGVEACVEGQCESTGIPCPVGETCDELQRACVPTTPPPPELSADALPDFSLPDVNVNSSRHQENVSPRDYLGQISAWYFGHST